MRLEPNLPSIAVAGCLAAACGTRARAPAVAESQAFPPTSLAPFAMGVAEAQPTPTDDAIAIEVVATTMCDRAVECAQLDSGPEYDSTDACLKQAREAATDNLHGKGTPCSSAVQTAPLNRCLADLANRPCPDRGQAIASVPSCEAAKLCL
jgi:hypothetical protein